MKQPSRRLRPGVERVESRDLPSGFTTMLATSGRPHPSIQELAQVNANSGGSSGNQVTPVSTPPVVPGQGQPTPHEQARDHFHAVFNGPFYQGPGRFSDQSKTFYYRGVGGSTNFLHGDFQMSFVIPTNPDVPITGASYMQDKNVNSGGVVGFDLVADPTSLDRLGRPTRATFTNDPNIYGGIFFFDTSSGNVRISYHGGAATVVFDGTVYTNGLTNPLRNTDLVARGGRLFNHRGAHP